MKDKQVETMRIGAVVRLNSGGEPFTVTGWHDDSQAIGAPDRANDPKVLVDIDQDDIHVHVAWITDDGKAEQATFPASCLEMVS